MENKNYGILIAPPKPTDYIAGVDSKISTARSVKDWSIYLPSNESQYNKSSDFLNCVTMSAGHTIETQLNYLLFTNQLSDEALNFFHNNNYIVDGLFKISKRFNAKLSGTDISKGNYLNVVADCFHKYGFIPNSLLPMSTTMTWDEYYAPIPQNLIDLGKKALWFINIQYQWINKDEMPNFIPIGPVQVATEVCSGWDSGQVVLKCTGQPIQHATDIYGQDSSGNWLDFDSYPPYRQKLAPDYELPINMHYVVSMKPITLKNGMYGTNVLALQTKLSSIGYQIAKDSSYGPMTASTVKSFQSKYGLQQDGIAGPKTLEVLNNIFVINKVCAQYGVEPELAIAVAQCESALNSKCRNINKGGSSTDKGLYQWNDKYHPEITQAMADDPEQSCILFCKAVKAGNLHAYWSASQHCWSSMITPDILKKYGIM